MQTELWVGCVFKEPCSSFAHSGFCSVTRACTFGCTLWNSTSPVTQYLLSMTATTVLPMAWYSVSSFLEP